MTIQTLRTRFPNAQGQMLEGRLEVPISTPLAYAVFAHCFTCGKDIFAATRIASQLAQRGIACLRFDFTGIGGSEGDFAETNFLTNISDLEAASAYLAAEFKAPHLLIGHSLGGTAALAAAANIKSIKAVITLNSPAEPNHVGRHFQDANRHTLETLGEAEIYVGGRPFKIRPHFFDTAQGFNMSHVYEKLQAAVLVLQAPTDETVHPRNAEQIFGRAAAPKAIITLDGMGHLLSKHEDAARIATLIEAWAQPYLSLD